METEGLTNPDPPPECQEPWGQAASSNATSPRKLRLAQAPPPQGGGGEQDTKAGANVRAAIPHVYLLGSRTGAQYLLAAPAPLTPGAVGGCVQAILRTTSVHPVLFSWVRRFVHLEPAILGTWLIGNMVTMKKDLCCF